MIQKIKKAFLSLLLLAFGAIVFGQNPTALRIGESFKTGDSETLATYLAPNISIGIDNSERSYSKAQAIQVFRSFFEKNPPVDFIFRHASRATPKDQFNVGGLKTENGNFRVTFFLTQNEDQPLIKRLRIEPK